MRLLPGRHFSLEIECLLIGLVLVRRLNHVHAHHLPPHFGLMQVVKLVNVIVKLAVQINLLGMLA